MGENRLEEKIRMTKSTVDIINKMKKRKAIKYFIIDFDILPTRRVNRLENLAQFLKTNDKIGFVITDVNREYYRKVLGELKKIPDTIKFRIIY